MSVGALAPPSVPPPASAAPAPSAPAPRRTLRASLAVKIAAALIGLVTLVLLVNGAINLWLSYDEAKNAAVSVQQEKAHAAADRIGQFVSDIENQIGWTTRAEWRRVSVEQQRYDFIRLLRQSPAVTEVSYLDPSGKEQLKVSRLEPDAVGSGKDFASEPRFKQAVADKTWFGPVYFRRGSEPYMTMALAHAGRNPGVTVAEVNLKLIWDVVTGIRVGDRGYAYVVNSQGRLIAHPDLSLVLRDTDLSRLPQVARALTHDSARTNTAEIVSSLDGSRVLSAHAPIARLGWLVFVQMPAEEALAPVYRSLWQTAALLALGLLLATVVGTLLARRMAVPIRELQAGAERLGAGDLSQRIAIRTGDEIETLADRFNVMASRIQESQETLEARVEERTRDLNETLRQQTATAEVLQVISRSAFDLEVVLDTLTKSAVGLCEADHGVIVRRDGDEFRLASSVGFSPEFVAFVGANPLPVGAGGTIGRAASSKQTVHAPDVLAEPGYRATQYQKLGGYRTNLAVPLIRDEVVIGIFALTRSMVKPFTAKQIELVETFADQALIAIENARLFEEVQARTREVTESLQQQTATAEVLKVISRSAFDLDSVLSTLTRSAAQLCGVPRGLIFLRDGDVYRIGAAVGLTAEIVQYFKDNPRRGGRGSVVARAILSGQVEQIPDFTKDPEFWTPGRPDIGSRAMLGVPLMRDGRVEGVFVLSREPPGPFPERQVELVQTFADQAVIAIENARLFEQVQARTRELTESLQQQTATADVLKVISRSTFDLKAVLTTLVQSARELCNAPQGMVLLRDGDVYRTEMQLGYPAEFEAYISSHPIVPNPHSGAGKAAFTGQVAHFPDVLADPEYQLSEGQRLGGYRALLSIPLLREQEVVGVFSLGRPEPTPFTERQIELVQTFADQAVIAIENVRLFDEVQARTKELTESLAQQTATADVLKVISRSAFDLEAVLSTLTESAVELCGVSSGLIYVRQGEDYRLGAAVGLSPDGTQHFRDHPRRPGRDSLVPRVAVSGKVEQVSDILADPEWKLPRHPGSTTRAALGVPLLRNGAVEGVFVLMRPDPGLFPPRQVELVQTFADQAVIAIQNARLFDEVQARTKELQVSLDDLRKAQNRLVQSEKLASLGQLTAGIAHEIKNPLNFVNNFSSLSTDLIDELREVLETGHLDGKARDDVDELTGMLKSNLEKVVQHGKRADSIVKNMLLHSREGSGEHRLIGVNGVVEESMNLAYHGARAEKPGFNVTLRKELDPEAGEADLYPQEITRVLLNLFSNGFYAATKRKADMDGSFEPTITASTRNLGDKVEIRIRDNGTGIPDEVRAKMFNPFFTTKPAGEGTGLGLSLSHDIVVKQHGGTIEVASLPGEFTEFTILLPRAGVAAAGKSGA